MGGKVCKREGYYWWKGIGGRYMGKGGTGGKVCEREGYYWWEGYVCKGIGGRFMREGMGGKGRVLLVGRVMCVRG